LPTRDASHPPSRDVRTTRVSYRRRAVACQLAPFPRLRVATDGEARAGTRSFQAFELCFHFRSATLGVAPANHFAPASARHSSVGVSSSQLTGRIAHKPCPHVLRNLPNRLPPPLPSNRGCPFKQGHSGFDPDVRPRRLGWLVQPNKLLAPRPGGLLTMLLPLRHVERAPVRGCPLTSATLRLGSAFLPQGLLSAVLPRG
jgi:hypothetical protein